MAEGKQKNTSTDSIDISINKKILITSLVVLLTITSVGGVYFSYSLSEKVSDLESENNNLADRNRELKRNLTRLLAENQEMEENISRLKTESVQVKYNENIGEIESDVREIVSGGDFEGILEIQNSELRSNMAYMEVRMSNTSTTQVQKAYVSLDGKLLFPVREQLGNTLSPINIPLTLEQME